MIRVTIPIRTVSEANVREHWAKRAKRVAGHRSIVRLALNAKVAVRGALTVSLTRIATRKLDDDNLRSALKATRDGVADALGIDDGDESIRWEYEQEKAREPGVRIEIRKRES